MGNPVIALSPLFEREFYIFEQERKAGATENHSYDQGEIKRPYNVVNGVAIYSIDGAMVDKGDWYTRWTGAPDYETMSDVFSQMAQDEEVSHVLLRVGTPGGYVSGLSDVGDSLASLNAKKPTTVHSTSHIASAGMWLSSYADKIYGSEVAEFGSIGVIINHMSYEGALEDAGLKFTQIKSKPRKAMGSPYQDLSKEAEEYLQRKVDEADGLFEKRMKEGRPGVAATALNGEMFSAHDATKMGLIDGVRNFMEVFKEVAALAAETDENNSLYGGYDVKRKMTEEMAAAAIEAGANPETIEVVSQEEYDALSEEERNPVEATEETSTETVEEPEVGAEATEDIEVALDDLEAQVDELVVANAELQEKVEALEAEAKLTEDALAQVETMKNALVAVMAQRRVALGFAKVDFSELSAAQVMQEYETIEKTFKKSFVVGGLTKKSVETQTTGQTTAQSGLERAQQASVGIN